jgi:hypothetical protein
MLLALAAFAWLNAPAAGAEKHTSPLTTIMNTHLYTDPGPVPDWVEKSRPAAGGSDYIKLHESPPERHAKPKTPAELKAMAADLDAAAAANRRRAALPAGEAKKSGKLSTVRSEPAAPIH